MTGIGGRIHRNTQPWEGLIALTNGKANLTCCLLWDQESDSSNASFVRRVLLGQRVALLSLSHRSLGLIVPTGNPAKVTGLVDLPSSELRFFNRQAGSVTRIWMYSALDKTDLLSKEASDFLTLLEWVKSMMLADFQPIVSLVNV